MQVTCPYCECDVDIDDSNLVDLDPNNYIEDYECDNCGKEFDVYVEFEPVGNTEKIIYERCDCCKEEDKTRNFYKRGSTFPFPDDMQYYKLCHSCYGKLMVKQWKQEDKNKT